MILAGGQGTRLRPLTLARAKPVVPLLNRPFLAYQLALLRAHGVSDVILACSYRVDDVRAALGDGRAARRPAPVRRRGRAARHRRRRPQRRRPGVGAPLFVLNGDVLTDADLTAMRALPRDARLAHDDLPRSRSPIRAQYGLVETERRRAPARASARSRPPTRTITTNTINAGIYLHRRRRCSSGSRAIARLDRARVLSRAHRRRRAVLRLVPDRVLARHRQPAAVPRGPDRSAPRARGDCRSPRPGEPPRRELARRGRAPSGPAPGSSAPSVVGARRHPRPALPRRPRHRHRRRRAHRPPTPASRARSCGSASTSAPAPSLRDCVIGADVRIGAHGARRARASSWNPARSSPSARRSPADARSATPPGAAADGPTRRVRLNR